MLTINERGINMANIKRYSADAFAKAIIRNAKLTSYDAIYVRNSFTSDRYIELLAVKNFNKYNDNNDAIVKITIDRETGNIISFIVHDDIKMTDIGNELSKWIDSLMSLGVVIDVDFTVYKRHHSLLYTVDNITMVIIPDPIIDDAIMHYFFIESTKAIYKCIEPTDYRYHPDNMTYEEFEDIVSGLANGTKILPNSIGTSHIQDKSITPQQLDRAYSEQSEIYAARTDCISGEKHESLEDHFKSIGTHITELREMIERLVVIIDG